MSRTLSDTDFTADGWIETANLNEDKSAALSCVMLYQQHKHQPRSLAVILQLGFYSTGFTSCFSREFCLLSLDSFAMPIYEIYKFNVNAFALSVSC